MKKCNSLINIPTGTKYTSLNLSHAVAIILYELRDKKPKKKATIVDSEAEDASEDEESEFDDLNLDDFDD